MKVKRYKHNNAHIPQIEGVTISGEIVEFDSSFSQKDIDFLRGKVKSGIGAVQFVSPSKAYEPTDSDREKIKTHLRGNKDISGFGIYQAIAAKDMMIDRDGDILERDFLEILAKRYREGRSMVDSHNRNQRIGKTFDAEVSTNEKGQAELLVKFYIPPAAKMLSGNSAKMEIDSGMVENVSVSFVAPSDALTFIREDDNENTYGVPHFRYHAPTKSPDESIEVFELSMVTMGAQQGARVKNLTQNPLANYSNEKGQTFASETINNSETMDLKKIRIKSVGETINVPESDLEAVQTIDEMFSEVQEEKAALEKTIKERDAEIKKLNARLGKNKGEKITELVNLKKQIFGEDKIDAETEKAALEEMEHDFIIAQINQFKGLGKTTQLNPGAEGEEGDQESREAGNKELKQRIINL